MVSACSVFFFFTVSAFDVVFCIDSFFRENLQYVGVFYLSDLAHSQPSLCLYTSEVSRLGVAICTSTGGFTLVTMMLAFQ